MVRSRRGRRYGISEELVQQVGGVVQSGQSALFLMATAFDPEDVVWTACFQHPKTRFRVCGRMEDSIMRVQFTEPGSFHGRGDDVKRDVVEKLRSAFGERRVRACGFTWRGVEKCPTLVQLDSGA